LLLAKVGGADSNTICTGAEHAREVSLRPRSVSTEVGLAYAAQQQYRVRSPLRTALLGESSPARTHAPVIGTIFLLDTFSCGRRAEVVASHGNAGLA
jgi:hypothetical protein